MATVHASTWDGSMRNTLWLAAGCAAAYLTTSWSVLYPVLRLHLATHLLSPRRLSALYSVGDSNLDVLALLLLATAVDAGRILAARGASVSKRGGAEPRWRAVLGHVVVALALFKQLVVAVWCSTDAWPAGGHDDGEYHAGAVCLCVSIPAATVAVWILGTLATRWTQHRSRQGETRRGAAAEALLPDDEAECQPSGQAAASPADNTASDADMTATMKELGRLASSDAHLLAIAFACGILAAVGQSLIPYYTGLGVDAASTSTSRGLARFHGIIARLLAAAGGTALLAAGRGGLFTLIAARLNTRLRERLFGHLLQQETGFFDAKKTGELTSRLSADCSTVSDQVSLNANILARSAMQAAAVLAFMLAANWRLTIVTLVLIPINIQVCGVYGRYYRQLSKDMQTRLAAANVVADETLAALATVRAHAAEQSVQASYAAELRHYYLLTCKAAIAYSIYVIISTFFPQGVAAVVLLYGGHLTSEGDMTRAQLVSFMFYQATLAGAMGTIADIYSSLMAAVGAAAEVVRLLRREPRERATGTLAPPQVAGLLEFKAVHFSYPTRPTMEVLRGVSFEARPGQTVALVGSSGSGKSSVVKLIEALYRPSAGAITLDGVALHALQPRALKRHLALVSQEPVLFARSIERNIMLGLEAEDGCERPPTHEQVVEAARQASAHDFIMALPQGYDTECGDRGCTLSGGQKQRIAIARALVRDPRVLLLDEATSALDGESEAAVQAALSSLMRGRTTLVIAHRLSTVRDADEILVMAKGLVVERGRHDDLVAAGGVYAGLARRQLTSQSMASLASQGSSVSLSTLQ